MPRGEVRALGFGDAERLGETRKTIWKNGEVLVGDAEKLGDTNWKQWKLMEIDGSCTGPTKKG